MHRIPTPGWVLLLLWLLPATLYLNVCRGQTKIIGHWKLSTDARDSSGNNFHGKNHGVRFSADGAANFDGQRSWIEISEGNRLLGGTNDFSLSVWVHTAEELTDVLGDILSYYDASTRTGINFSIMNYAGVTNAQANWRNIHFGIDAGKIDPIWNDEGRPGNNHYVRSLTVYNGALYASTWEPAEGDRGHVYRYAGEQQWVDCGAPDPANCIATLAVYDGQLYAGSELYSGGGSSLPLSPNEKHGGVVYRYEGGQEWTNLGKVADVRSVSGFAVFGGKLYAGTGSTGAWRDTPRTRGMYRFDGKNQWTSCGCPDLRVVHLGVYNDHLLGLSYDAGGFFRYQGEQDWLRLGPIPETTQAYGMAVYETQVHVATWPTGSVYRLNGPQDWSHRGRLGEEKEVMGMLVYNGKLYAGTLPQASVFRYDGGTTWTDTGRLDLTPDVRYRRAWSMAIFDGKLFCGVLPSGHVYSLEAGKNVTHDHALPAGWQHLTVTKGKDCLRLYINGDLVAQSTTFDRDRFNLTNDQPLRIGTGQHDYFNGRLQDLRIYEGQLSPRHIRQIAQDNTMLP